jgi:hypothetical protein
LVASGLSASRDHAPLKDPHRVSTAIGWGLDDCNFSADSAAEKAQRRHIRDRLEDSERPVLGQNHGELDWKSTRALYAQQAQAADTTEPDQSGSMGLTLGVIDERVVVEDVERGSSGVAAAVRTAWDYRFYWRRRRTIPLCNRNQSAE